jgi:glycosyltransferase involved in cell wall biosynthesis
MVSSLTSEGHEVFAFDPTEAVRYQTKGTSVDQIEWIFNQFKPEIVMSVPCTDPVEQDLIRACAQFSVHRRMLAVEDLVDPSGIDEAEEIPAAVGPVEVLDGPPLDLAILGSADDRRADIVRSCVAQGLTIVCVGTGWDEYADLRRYARGPHALPYVRQVIGGAKICVVTAGVRADLRVDIGPIHAALVAASAGIPLVAEEGCGVDRYFDEGEFIVAQHDAIVSTIVRYLDDTLALTEAAGRAEAKVASRWSWSNRWSELRSAASPVVAVKPTPALISHIWPMYNAEPFIGDAIRSILDQTYSNIELVIYDDGSTDGSAAVVDQFSDPRLRFLRGPNVGQTGRFDFLLNVVTRASTGEYVSLLGADDIAFPERAQRELEVFREDPGVDVVHTGGVLINEKTEAMGQVFQLDFSYDTTSMLRRLLQGNSVASPTFLMRRSFIERLGSWGGGFATDYNFWVRAARVGRFRFLPECLMAYRQHGGNASIGSGVDESQRQALVTRLPERDLTSLTDLYPALRYVGIGDRAAWTAAYMDVGNGHLRYVPSPASAIREYELALAVAADEHRPVIEFNRALALHMAGDHAEAVKIFEYLSRTSPEMAAHMTSSETWTPLQASMISNAPFRLPDEVAKSVICWDGTPASQERVLVIPDWSRPHLLAATIERYLSTFDGSDEIDLVIPTLGIETDLATEHILRSISAGTDLASAAELTLEPWNDLGYLPADRFALVIDHQTGNSPAQIDGSLAQFAEIRKKVLKRADA